MSIPHTFLPHPPKHSLCLCPNMHTHTHTELFITHFSWSCGTTKLAPTYTMGQSLLGGRLRACVRGCERMIWRARNLASSLSILRPRSTQTCTRTRPDTALWRQLYPYCLPSFSQYRHLHRHHPIERALYAHLPMRACVCGCSGEVRRCVRRVSY